MWFKIVLLLARGVCGRLHYILLLDDYDDNDDESDNGEEPGYPGVCGRVLLYFNDYDDFINFHLEISNAQLASSCSIPK